MVAALRSSANTSTRRVNGWRMRASAASSASLKPPALHVATLSAWASPSRNSSGMMR